MKSSKLHHINDYNVIVETQRIQRQLTVKLHVDGSVITSADVIRRNASQLVLCVSLSHKLRTSWLRAINVVYPTVTRQWKGIDIGRAADNCAWVNVNWPVCHAADCCRFNTHCINNHIIATSRYQLIVTMRNLAIANSIIITVLVEYNNINNSSHITSDRCNCLHTLLTHPSKSGAVRNGNVHMFVCCLCLSPARCLSQDVLDDKGKYLYSAFIVVPHTQGAQVRITQCYLQITPYLPLPR